MSKPKKVYVGCGLTGASPESLEHVKCFKDRLREAGYEVLNFYGSKEVVMAHPELGGQGIVYKADIQNGVGTCDFFVGIMDEPSHGLGLEIGAALYLNPKPVLMLAKEGVTISALMVDLALVFAERPVVFQRYQTLEDMVMLVDVFAEALSPSAIW